MFIEQRWIDKDAERKKDKQKIKILDKQITKKKGGGVKRKKEITYYIGRRLSVRVDSCRCPYITDNSFERKDDILA